MDFEIVVKKTGENVFAATSPQYPGCRGTGRTEESAIHNLRASVATWIPKDATPMNAWVKDPVTGKTGNPWLDSAGIFADDPTWEEFQANIAEYRRQQDAEDLAKKSITDKAA